MHYALDEAFFLESIDSLSCKGTTDLHSVDEDGDRDQLVCRNLLVDTVIGWFVEDNKILSLVLHLSLGPLLLLSLAAR